MFNVFDKVQCDERSACVSFADKCNGNCEDCKAFAADMDAFHAQEAVAWANVELQELALTESALCV